MENGYFHTDKRLCTTNLRRILLRKTKFSKEIRRQNQESYFIFNYFFIEYCVLYEIMCKHMVNRYTEHDYRIQHMCFACC